MEQQYEKWSKESTISENQLDYVKRLYKRMNEVDKFNSIENFLLSKFNTDIKMNYKNYLIVIKYLEQGIKLNENEKSILLSHQYNDDTRLYDLRNILGINNDINIHNCITKNNIPSNNVVIMNYSTDYEYGIQVSKKCVNSQMYYLKLYNLMVIDYDNVNIETVIKKLKSFKDDYLFKIYKTYNGYHVLVVSHVLPYNDENSTKLSYIFDSDKMYTLYSKFNGYNIRLSPKIGYNETITHEYIMDYGRGKILKQFEKLIDLFEKLNKECNTIIDQEFGYFNSYVKINNSAITNSFPINKDFTQFVLKNNKLTYEIVKLLSVGYINYIKKPQKCLIDEKEYYVAIDMNTNLCYICYKNILMIDIDDTNIDNVMNLINKGIEKYDDTYVLYKSINGFHIFVLNKYFDHLDKNTIEYLIDFNCDTNYIMCTYIRSFCTRLNKKQKDENNSLYELVGYYKRENKSFDVSEDILNLVNLQHYYIEKFNNFLRPF